VIDDIAKDFLVSNATDGGDFILRRIDNASFSLDSMNLAGLGSTTIGGIAYSGAGNQVWADFNVSGQSGMTNVTSVLFSPSDYIQISSFSTAVPIPAAVWLFGSALAGLGWMRRRKTV
jgi:hypothetical protein